MTLGNLQVATLSRTIIVCVTDAVLLPLHLQRGSEVTLDCCAYPFNFLQATAQPTPYIPPGMLRWLGHGSATGMAAAPAFYFSRTVQGQLSSAVPGQSMYEVQQRHSFKDMPTCKSVLLCMSDVLPLTSQQSGNGIGRHCIDM